MNKYRYLIVIPARFKSSRFPGKPLAIIKGQSMIERVWRKCLEVVDSKKIIIATDNQKIKKHCSLLGMNVVMTSKKCLTGTDRVYEISKKIDATHYINVQGDEPLIEPKDILKIINISKKNKDYVINAMSKIKLEKDFRNYNVPKVVCDLKSNLMYMTRRNILSNKKNEFHRAMKQVCIYSFPKKNLQIYGEYNTKTPLEKIEDIEILRFKELGIKIKMVEVSETSVAVDTPADLKRVELLVK